MFDENKKIDSVQFKCPSCGNNMEFVPGTTKMRCPYCATEEEIDDLARVDEQMLTEGDLKETFDDEVEVFKCMNCGAVSEAPKGAISFACPYCHKTNVVKQEDIKGIKPTGVVPFKIEKSTAVKSARENVRKKLFVAFSIKKADFNTMLSGVYSPIWTFDTNTLSDYQGRVGKYHTKTVGSGKNRRTVTEIRWYNVSGTIEKFYNEIRIAAREMIEDKKVSKISDFNTDNAAKYDKRFLAGFSALHYEKPLAKAFSEAKSVIRNDLLQTIKHKHGADVIDDSMRIHTRYLQPTYKYILAPFYLGAFEYKTKRYPMVINGSTGSVWAKYPLSPVKIGIAVLLGLALIAGIAYLYMLSEGIIQT